MSACDECIRCPECGAVAYCLAEVEPLPPCAHGTGYCGDHNLNGCVDCRLEAEREMHESGDYSPEADPFVNPHARESDAAYWASLPPEVPGSPGIFRHPVEDSA